MDELSTQVQVLSTKLLQAIDRQAELEDEVRVLRKELDTTRREKIRLEDRIETDYIAKEVADKQNQLRVSAEMESKRIEGEMVELSNSLFTEANNLVADANRQTAEWKLKNDHLQQQLEERDVLLENLQQQLGGLKLVLEEFTEREREQEKSKRRSGIVGPVASSLSMPGTSNSGKALLAGTNIKDSTSSSQHHYHSQIDSFNSSIRPMLRRDLTLYDDFKQLILWSSIRSGLDRGNSLYYDDILRSQGSPTAAASTMNSGISTSTSTSTATMSSSSNSSTSTLTNTTTTTTTLHISPWTTTTTRYSPALKEFRFYKRSLTEDIEPALRLDLAPGLSWLQRRSVMSSIIDGTVVVEPISGINEGKRYRNDGESPRVSREISRDHDSPREPLRDSRDSLSEPPQTPTSPSSFFSSNALAGNNGHAVPASPRGQFFSSDRPIATKSPCTLCGESRNDSLVHSRLHNLRISKDKDGDGNHGHGSSLSTSSLSSVTGSNGGLVSTGYPLCHFCVNRVRTVCDFVAFLRAVRDGVWKVTVGQESEERAWNECIRLKERMFWARVGGSFDDFGMQLAVPDGQGGLPEGVPEGESEKEVQEVSPVEENEVVDGDTRVITEDNEAEHGEMTVDEAVDELANGSSLVAADGPPGSLGGIRNDQDQDQEQEQEQEQEGHHRQESTEPGTTYESNEPSELNHQPDPTTIERQEIYDDDSEFLDSYQDDEIVEVQVVHRESVKEVGQNNIS